NCEAAQPRGRPRLEGGEAKGGDARARRSDRAGRDRASPAVPDALLASAARARLAEEAGDRRRAGARRARKQGPQEGRAQSVAPREANLAQTSPRRQPAGRTACLNASASSALSTSPRRIQPRRAMCTP